MKRIVIFASGSGSNAENLIRYFAATDKARVEAVFCNRSTAGVIRRAEDLQVPVHLFSRQQLIDGEVAKLAQKYNPDLIVLAGFLLQIPDNFIADFPNKIVNIHPALLPKYGGAGMFGMHVHNAIVAARETETGITIHYVDENYDSGDIIAQYKVALSGSESSEQVAQKVQQLEQQYFPKVIEDLLNNNPRS